MSNGKQFTKLFVAQIKMMFREKQVWFWNLFFPIILMVIFMVIFGSGGGSDFKASIAVVKPAAGEAADNLETQLRQIPVLEWKSDTPVDAALADKWLKDEDVDAVIVLPATNEAAELELIVNKENETNATSQAVAGILDRFVQQANLAAAGVTEPAYALTRSSVSSGSEDLSAADFLLTGMIALSLAQGGLFGMVDLVEMRRKGLLKRLRMTPMKMGMYGLGSMLVRFVLGVVQVVMLTVIGVFGFGAHLHVDVPTVLVAFFIGGLAFNAIGYCFSSFSKSMEAYMGMANIASFLMMFLSGVFFTVSNMPEWLQAIASVIPLTYFVNGMRDGLVYGSGLLTAGFWQGVAVQAAWGAAAFAIGALLYRKGKVEGR